MLERYYTVKPEGTAEQIIQKSRFLSYVKRTETEEEAQQFIQSIKKKHADATHNCSAYIIGEHDQIQKANDDGEPSGTAGVPILEVLKKRELKDTTVVVTRYFGGIKLGAGGLIRAYASSATLGVNGTGVVERRLMQEYLVTVEYPLLGKIENDIQKTNFLLDQIEYTDKVTLHIFVNSDETDTFIDWMNNLSHAAAEITKGTVTYKEIDVPNP
ncbi:putative YigZ family protein [Gracilibacillus halotolerans]|uniref:Putative YigZ family protein n=1 Tax=Gracilibacillus halotolerans TaxID=74386 RepID=A0A841RKX4_9BACI|nr:YigZ family protein [Gracilibacillus halotolerans]MBB6512273.1 putative YigZ family protein [Gracilibacillus halotolerans]